MASFINFTLVLKSQSKDRELENSVKCTLLNTKNEKKILAGRVFEGSNTHKTAITPHRILEINDKEGYLNFEYRD